jgi:hypothetical protein
MSATEVFFSQVNINQTNILELIGRQGAIIFEEKWQSGLVADRMIRLLLLASGRPFDLEHKS